MIKQYRKKPVTIEAVQWTGKNIEEIKEFVGKKCRFASDILRISTLRGTYEAIPGDYIIKGIDGEFYKCKPGIFKHTYEEI